MSEGFEKLPEIAERIDGWVAFRNDRYWNKSTGYVDQYLTGAWYAYQEQQKRIDVLSKRLNEAVSLVADDLEKALRGEHE